MSQPDTTHITIKLGERGDVRHTVTIIKGGNKVLNKAELYDKHQIDTGFLVCREDSGGYIINGEGESLTLSAGLHTLYHGGYINGSKLRVGMMELSQGAYGSDAQIQSIRQMMESL